VNDSRADRWISALIALLIAALGAWLFIGPFFSAPEQMADPTAARAARAQEVPILLLAFFALCLTMIVANLETRRLDSRWIALLGVLVAINATLRLVSGPLGASAVFLLPIVCGFAWGAEFGFLLGSLSILASAFLTAGMGPWLPFQMFAAGWCGMVSGWLPRLRRFPICRWLMLSAWAGLSGFLYGVALNLWFWPYLAEGATQQEWSPGLGFTETVLRYAVFYAATSLWWDAGRALGNVILVLAFAPALLRLLDRFRKRFRFQIDAEV